jgi:S-adenosylmethionine decarboxylase proenzyme
MRIIDINTNRLCAEDVDFPKRSFLGTHVLCEFHDCNENIINDIRAIERIMISAAKKCRSTILKQSFHKFSPQGVSGILLIEESHLSIHTWPEIGYAAADIFTCSFFAQEKFEKIVNFLKTSFNSQKFSVLLVKRGENFAAERVCNPRG